MIVTATIAEIVALYKKHGWTLRRVLLCAKSKMKLSQPAVDAFGSVEVREADLDALWFSRRSKPDSEAWELRRLGGSPFALVAVIDNKAEKDEIENILAATEVRMREARVRETSH